MRRKFNSNKSLALIIVIAIFTVSSYFFDQMVIRNEDSLRNLNIDLDNMNVEISNLNGVRNQIESAQESVLTKYLNNKRYSNYWFKNLLLTGYHDINPELKFDKVINSFKYKDINNDVKLRLIEFYYQAVVEHNTIIKKIDNIYVWQEILFPQYFTKENKITYFSFPELNFLSMFDEVKPFLNYKNFNFYSQIFSGKEYLDEEMDRAINNYTLENWTDIHKYTYKLINKYTYYLDIFKDDIEYLEDLIMTKEDVRSTLVEKITAQNTKKNFLILTSIISQILSLFFLLLLFRSLIINIKKKKYNDIR